VISVDHSQSFSLFFCWERRDVAPSKAAVITY
jgi:hypothetical protein